MTAPELRRLRRLVTDVRTALTMPRTTIVLSRGTPEEDEVLRDARRPHPRYRVVGRKVVGVAVLPLDEIRGIDDYLADLRRVRRGFRTAQRRGYATGLFDPNHRRADLLAIHRSMPARQGRPMDPEYLDATARYPTGQQWDYLGVWRGDVLVGYGRLQYAGDVASVDRILGHGDHLEDGIMHLLVARMVEHVKAARPQTRYLIYDMFFGASDGLRQFKTMLGFRPHYVRWTRQRESPKTQGREH